MAEIIFDETIDWDARILCSDESCIGTIGPDGKCKECGKSYEGVLPTGFKEQKEQTITADDKKAAVVAVTENSTDDDWDKRVLCSDESCIGIIGPDGKCKECGKPGSK
jgi:hypothetical protein